MAMALALVWFLPSREMAISRPDRPREDRGKRIELVSYRCRGCLKQVIRDYRIILPKQLGHVNQA